MIITPSPKIYHFNTSRHQSIFANKFFIYGILIILLGIGIFIWQRELAKIKSASAREITETQEQFYLNQKNALEKSNKNAFELTVTGKKMLDKNYFPAAEAYFEIATKKDPDYRDAYFYLGYAYLKITEELKNKETKELFDEKTIEQFNNLTMDKSLEAFLKARDLDPLYAPTYEFLAYIYNKLGNEENARLAYEKAEELKNRETEKQKNS